MKTAKELLVKEVKNEEVKQKLGFGEDQNQDACCM